MGAKAMKCETWKWGQKIHRFTKIRLDESVEDGLDWLEYEYHSA